jgi:hypothetical protein
MDGVRAGRVYDVDLSEQAYGGSHEVCGSVYAPTLDLVTVFQQTNALGCRCDAFLEDRLAEKCVDEETFSGIELADDNEQKKLIELSNRGFESRLVVGRDIDPGQGHPYVGQNVSFFSEQLGLFVV